MSSSSKRKRDAVVSISAAKRQSIRNHNKENERSLNGTPWTPEQRRILRCSLSNGENYKDIAQKLHRTELGVRFFAKRNLRLGKYPSSGSIEMSRWSVEEIRRLESSIAIHGFDYVKISAAVGRTYYACESYCRRHKNDLEAFLPADMRTASAHVPAASRTETETASVAPAPRVHDSRLRKAVKTLGASDVKRVAIAMGVQEDAAATALQAYSAEKGRYWSKDEERALGKAIAKYGTRWKAVSGFLGTKTAMQCKNKCDALKRKGKSFLTPNPDKQIDRDAMALTKQLDSVLERYCSEADVKSLREFDIKELLQRLILNFDSTLKKKGIGLNSAKSAVRTTQHARNELAQGVTAENTTRYLEMQQNVLIQILQEQSSLSNRRGVWIRLVKKISSMCHAQVQSSIKNCDKVSDKKFKQWLHGIAEKLKPLSCDFKNNSGILISLDNVNFRIKSKSSVESINWTSYFLAAFPPSPVDDCNERADILESSSYSFDRARILLPKHFVRSIYDDFKGLPALNADTAGAAPLTYGGLLDQRIVRQCFLKTMQLLERDDLDFSARLSKLAAKELGAIVDSVRRSPKLVMADPCATYAHVAPPFVPDRSGLSKHNEGTLHGMALVFFDILKCLDANTRSILEEFHNPDFCAGLISGDHGTLKNIKGLMRELQLLMASANDATRTRSAALLTLLSKFRLIPGDFHTSMNQAKCIVTLYEKVLLLVAEHIDHRGIGSLLVTKNYQRHSNFLETDFGAHCMSIFLDALESGKLSYAKLFTNGKFNIEAFGEFFLNYINGSSNARFQYFVVQYMQICAVYFEFLDATRLGSSLPIVPSFFAPITYALRYKNYADIYLSQIDFNTDETAVVKQWLRQVRSVSQMDSTGTRQMALDALNEVINGWLKKFWRAKGKSLADLDKIASVIFYLVELGNVGDELCNTGRKRKSQRPRIRPDLLCKLVDLYRACGCLQEAVGEESATTEILREYCDDTARFPSKDILNARVKLLGEQDFGCLVHYSFSPAKGAVEYLVCMDNKKRWISQSQLTTAEVMKRPLCDLCHLEMFPCQVLDESGSAHLVCMKCKHCASRINSLAAPRICEKEECLKRETELRDAELDQSIANQILLARTRPLACNATEDEATVIKNTDAIRKCFQNVRKRGSEIMKNKKVAESRELERVLLKKSLEESKALFEGAFEGAASSEVSAAPPFDDGCTGERMRALLKLELKKLRQRCDEDEVLIRKCAEQQEKLKTKGDFAGIWDLNRELNKKLHIPIFDEDSSDDENSFAGNGSQGLALGAI